jgi:hypothetical protein
MRFEWIAPAWQLASVAQLKALKLETVSMLLSSPAAPTHLHWLSVHHQPIVTRAGLYHACNSQHAAQHPHAGIRHIHVEAAGRQAQLLLQAHCCARLSEVPVDRGVADDADATGGYA